MENNVCRLLEISSVPEEAPEYPLHSILLHNSWTSFPKKNFHKKALCTMKMLRWIMSTTVNPLVGPAVHLDLLPIGNGQGEVRARRTLVPAVAGCLLFSRESTRRIAGGGGIRSDEAVCEQEPTQPGGGRGVSVLTGIVLSPPSRPPSAHHQPATIPSPATQSARVCSRSTRPRRKLTSMAWGALAQRKDHRRDPVH